MSSRAITIAPCTPWPFINSAKRSQKQRPNKVKLKTWHGAIVLVLSSLLLPGCGSSSGQRYQIANDHTPSSPPDLDAISDPVPRYEPKSRQGNMKKYTVRGKQYQVMDSADGFSAEGEASWYGAKFHGHLTSNGEIYDMYSLSAAHKSLPLPTYVRVTNLKNERQVIVRVNDRGPFHGGRIIDLSYAAAYKLDMLKSGTAQVKIEAITLTEDSSEPVNPDPIEPYFVQVLVTGNEGKANQLASQLSDQFDVGSLTLEKDGLHKLRLGPLNNVQQAEALLAKLRAEAFPNAFLIRPNE
ncbi:septal ring lytic transglycosylase RlpA family protein [Corallincola spongiicola]|uniref:Endolytic peptidoglycan transglycosylase RlpA n=1 Tax=Corallincola spongiicola TaxID=2520508 RepID=A0ABY1WMZ9_9GAMM|nr:septal ring lytic transglycosylase RlpA family protein [Corallincola spongiicola]